MTPELAPRISASPDRGEPLGVVDVLISSETTKHRLPQPTHERRAAVLSCARVGKRLDRRRRQAECR
jgi:hypothetical protein